MASYNVFAPKKPKYLQTGYGLQTTSTPASSAYSSPSTMTSSTVKSAAPIASYKYSTPTQPTTPRINYSLTSGTTAKSAVNPTNYVAPTAPPPAKVPSVAEKYLNTLSDSATQRQALAEKQRQQQEEFTKQQYALLNQGLDNSAGQYKGDFERFKTSSEAGIKDLETTGEMQKSNARDYYGEAQRLAAKNRNEVRGQTQRTFANLNTLDSRGEGSFGQATENQDSAFNSFTQGNLKAQAQKLTEIDMQVGQAVRSAKAAVQQEESKLNGLLKQIELAKQTNNLEQARSLTQAYNETQQRIYDIQDNVDNLLYQFQLEQEKFAQAQEALTAETAGLSPEFLQSGTPTNRADQEFIFKNPDKAKTISELLKSSNGGAGNNQNKALTLVNNLLNRGGSQITGSSGTDSITGAVRTGGIPVISSVLGSSLPQADYDGLKSLLALAERGQLKGSGAVSDFEAQMLQKAAMAGLNQNLPDAEFRKRLQQLKTDLESGGATSSVSAGQVRVISPDGQVGMIDSSELQQALASGWRQQ